MIDAVLVLSVINFVLLAALIYRDKPQSFNYDFPECRFEPQVCRGECHAEPCRAEAARTDCLAEKCKFSEGKTKCRFHGDPEQLVVQHIPLAPSGKVNRRKR